MVEFVTELRGMLGSWAATPVWSALGWTMWYSLWIGLVQLGIGGVVMTLLRRASSELRYRVLLVLFGVLAATPAGIFLRVFPAEGEIAEFRPAMEVNWVPAVAGESEIPGEGAGKFVEPDRMPNALRSPWKPEEAGVSEPSGRVLVVPSRSVESAVDLPGGRGGWGAGAVNAWLVAGVRWLPLVWILGSPVTLACLGLGLIGAERYRRGARVLRNGAIVEQCRQLAERVGMRRGVFVGISERVVSPILIGIVRPLILLPITAETGWTPAQLEMVLLHELAHVRRWDNLVNLLQRLAEGVLFFQPAVWIVSRWLTLEREHCCDALVVKVTGRAQDYATALAELALAEHFPPGVASAMARHPLLGRIRRILGKEQPLQVSRGTLAVGLIVTVCCCALAGLVQGVEETEPPKKEAGVVIEGYAEGEKKVEGEGIAKRWRVVDVAGKPIEGVEVSAFSGGRSYPPETWKTPELKDPKNLIGKFTSDAEGKVQVQTPDNKPFILEFKKPGFMTLLKYSESWKRWGEDQARPEFVPTELMRAGTITVEVRGVDGLPASGVKLGCANYFHSKSLMDSTKFTNAVTDEKGQAVLTNLREGLVNLECTHTGSDQIKRTWSDCLILADGAKLIVRIDLAQSNSTINGSVKDDLNQIPLSDVTIEVEREWSFNEAAKTLDEATRRRILEGMPTNQVTFPRDLLTHGRYQIIRKWKGIQTDAEGKFDIGKIPAGNYHLTFTREPPSFHIPGTEFKQKIAEKDINLPANETVPIEVLADESSLGQQANRKSILPPVSSSDSERVTEIDSEHSVAFDSLPAKINLAIKSAGDRRLTAGLHTPWQVVQAIHGLKRDAELITPEGKKINALEWLATARTFQNEPLFEKTEWGGRAHPFTKPFVFEGHPTQFLAILSSCDLPLDYEFQTADGSPITVQDILNDAKMRVDEGTDLTWTLWALVHYLPVDASWKNSKGEDWSIERLVKHVAIPKSDSAPNTGSDMLYALAYARYQYLKTGRPLEGSWLRADELLKIHVEFIRQIQSSEFSFSVGLRDRRTTARDFKANQALDGHMLNGLVMALSPKELQEEWVRERIEDVADSLYQNRKVSADVGSFFHAIDALNLYRHRTSSDPKPLAYPLAGGSSSSFSRTSLEPPPTSDPIEPKQPDITPPVTLVRQIVHGGQGLQGVKVKIYTRDLQKPSDDKILTNSFEKKILAETETNSIGAIGISFPIPYSTPWIELKSPGLTTRRSKLHEVLNGFRSEQFFNMERGANVRFKVLDPQGQPLPGAILLVSPSEHRPTEAVISDAEGIVSLKDLPPGLVGVIYPFGAGPSTDDLTLKNPALAAFIGQFEEEHLETFKKLRDKIVFHNVTFMEEYWLDSGKTLEQTIDLRECRSRFEGNVVHKDGNPAALQDVWIWRLRPDTPLNDNQTQAWGGPGRLTLLTDEQGRFTLNRLNSGKYMFAPLRKRTDSQRIFIDGKQDYSRGFVIDRLSLTHELSNLEISPVIEDERSARMSRVNHGDIPIQRTEDLEDEGTDLLKRRWQIVDLAGSPIQGVEVVISAAPERQSNSTGQVNLPEKLVSDGEGWFEREFPRAKKLRLVLSKEGFLPVRLDFIDGRLQHENQETIAIRRDESIEMMRCGTLAVTVLGTDGKPVPGKKVSLTNLFSTRTVVRNTKQDLGVTNEKGEVTFRNLREGIVVLRPVEEQAAPVANFNWGKPIFIADGTSNSVTIDTSSFSAVLEGSFTSSTGEGVEGILIEIEREFSLREELAKIDPAAAKRIEPLSVQRMILNRPLGATFSEKPILSSVRTGQAGQFRIEGLLPGKYVVRAMMESEKISVTVVRPDGPQVELRQVRLAAPSQKPRHQVQRDKIVEKEVILKPDEVTSAVLVSPFPQLKLKPIEDFDSLDGGRAETLPVAPRDNIKPWNSTPPATKGPPPTAVKKSPLVHLELTGDSVRVMPENLRYDGKSFSEWVEVLRTEIKPERISEAIKVMVFFGVRGYEKEALAEIVRVLKETPRTYALRKTLWYSDAFAGSLKSLRTFGEASIPELLKMLHSDEPHELIVVLEALSVRNEFVTNWRDSLPLPSTEWSFENESKQINRGDLLGPPAWKENVELIAVLKSLMKHPSAEVRGRIYPAAVGCEIPETDLSEIFAHVLLDKEPGVWFSAIRTVGSQDKPDSLREEIRKSYQKLKEGGAFQKDAVRRNLFLRTLIQTSADRSPEEMFIPIPEILDDLKVTPIHEETAYWHLMSSAIPVSSEKAQSLRDALRKAAADLAGEEKIRVEGT